MAGRGGGASLPGMDPNAVAALVAHQQQQQAPVNPQLRATLNAFWANQGQEMQRVNDFKNHNLPLARIKKIMKSDEDVRMISSEAPALFAKACEMFILELTLRSWIHSEENKRRTLQRSDLATAIARTEVYDFLIDIVPQTAEGEDGDAGAAD